MACWYWLFSRLFRVLLLQRETLDTETSRKHRRGRNFTLFTGLSDGAEHRGAELQQVPVSGTPPQRHIHEGIDQLHDRNPLWAVRSPGGDRGRAEEETGGETPGSQRPIAAAAPRRVSPGRAAHLIPSLDLESVPNGIK